MTNYYADQAAQQKDNSSASQEIFFYLSVHITLCWIGRKKNLINFEA